MQNSNIEKHRAFLESLEGEKPWEFLTLGEDRWQEGDMMKYTNTGFLPVPKKWFGKIADATIFESGKRPVQIPDLKEKVKRLLRDGMDAAQAACEQNLSTRLWCERVADAQKFYALCEPEKNKT